MFSFMPLILVAFSGLWKFFFLSLSKFYFSSSFGTSIVLRKCRICVMYSSDAFTSLLSLFLSGVP